jgi:hypothetical protein
MTKNKTALMKIRVLRDDGVAVLLRKEPNLTSLE